MGAGWELLCIMLVRVICADVSTPSKQGSGAACHYTDGCVGFRHVGERLAVACAVANMPGDREHHYSLWAAAQIVIGMSDASVYYGLGGIGGARGFLSLCEGPVGQLRLNVDVSMMVVCRCGPLARGGVVVKLLGRLWLRCSNVSSGSGEAGAS